MPLRDHFRSPINDKHRWDAVHGGWPMEIVRTLFDILPAGYVAEPKVYHGTPFEVDVSMAEDDDLRAGGDYAAGGGTATLTAAAPTLTVVANLSETDEYEVRVYDADRERTLVAAIEIVSPANKDRPEARDQFVGKVAALLREDVCVAIVDLVTVRRANLFADVLARVGRSSARLPAPLPDIYAVSLRRRRHGPRRSRSLIDAWLRPMTVGETLPTIPLWLSPDLPIDVPLEPSYQEVCRLLRIPEAFPTA